MKHAYVRHDQSAHIPSDIVSHGHRNETNASSTELKNRLCNVDKNEQYNKFLQTKSVTKKQMNKCMAEK